MNSLIPARYMGRNIAFLEVEVDMEVVPAQAQELAGLLVLVVEGAAALFPARARALTLTLTVARVRVRVRIRNESSGWDHALAAVLSRVVLDLMHDGAEAGITRPPPRPHALRTPPDTFIVNLGFEVSHPTVSTPDDGSQHSEATETPGQHPEPTDPPAEGNQHSETVEDVGSWPLSGPTLQVIAQAAADELRNAADSATDPLLKYFLKAITLVGFVGAFAGIGMRCAGRSLSLVMFRIAATVIALGVIVALVMDFDIAVALFVGAVAFLISVASVWLP